jgi:sugar phosphate permease
MLTQKYKYLPFFMWFFPLIFFTYQFILRLWPSLMMNQIMQQFAVDASGFGLLASLYYYGYSSMQIPIAVMIDRFKARYIIFFCAVLCGIATLGFNYTNNWYLACLSRFLIGAGSAVGFLGVSKVISEWFPKDQYARMVGFSFSIGLMGAIYGGKPINIFVENYTWQKVALTLGFISIAIGIGTYLFLRSPKKSNSQIEQIEVTASNFKKLLSSPNIWLLAIANLLMVGSLEGFADVWGVQYLMTAYHLSKSNAAELTSFIFVGMLFGGPLLANLSKIFGNYLVISLCGLGMALTFILLMSNIQNNWYWIASLFFCIGIMCCYQVIVFAAGADLVSSQLLGVTIAFLNCVNMLGGSFFHTVIGLLMDASWTGIVGNDGVRQYTLGSYKTSLMIIPICGMLGATIVGLMRAKLYLAKSHSQANSISK